MPAPDDVRSAPGQHLTTRRVLVFAVSCLAVFSLAACSRPAPPSGGGTKSGSAAPASQPAAAPAAKALPHACDLLPVKDAEAVFVPGAKLVRDSEDTYDLATPNSVGPTVSVKIEPLSG